MRVVIQRVKNASVEINGRYHCKIQTGLLILVGIEDADNDSDIEWLSGKIIRLRIFNDEQGIMNLSAQDIQAEILLVSQFTLMAGTQKGNRPSYIRAAKPDVAIPLYEKLIKRLELQLGKKVQTGIFGADMQINLVNDGPVTVWIDTKNKE